MKALTVLAGGLVLLGLSTSAMAASINGSVWVGAAAGGFGDDATFANLATLGAPTDTFLVSALNFDTRVTGTTFGDFLTGAVGLDAGVAATSLSDDLFLFTGTTYLLAGNNNFIVTHDDGLEIEIGGTIVLSVPGPTAPVATPYNVVAPATGFYNFRVLYGECCSFPAVLSITVNDGPFGVVPEPATWGMMIAGFGLVGSAMRRRRETVVNA